MSKEEWKEAGTNLGHAWRDFGKTVVRSADRVVEKAKDEVDDHPNEVKVHTENGEEIVDVPENNGGTTAEPNSTVFSDGSWRKTMGGLGRAFRDVGKATLNSASEAVDSGKNE